MRANPTTQHLHALQYVDANPGEPAINDVPAVTLLDCERAGWIRKDHYLGYHLTEQGRDVWAARR